MSNRELAKNLIDQIPEETPNTDTLEAMAELENGGGYTFSGTTQELFAELIYCYEGNELLLQRTGTHSDLFNK